ncbi:MAG: type II secretion system F family protein [Methanosphaera sp.]|nr:type II secretion system F family protein [Methanosphaera sp.]
MLIMIGSYVLNSKSLLKNIKFRSKTDHKENNDTTTYKIDEKVNEEILENNDNTENHEKQVTLIIVIILLLLLLIDFNLFLDALTIGILIIIVNKLRPNIRKNRKRDELLKLLPFGLRQLSTQLKAGIGLFDAMKIVANSDYGELSRQFKITLNDIQYGTNYIEAFDKMAKRVDAPIMDKIISQITRTLTNGGNLADTLNTIANENSNNMKIKYKEYSQKLNSVMMLYMFIAVLIPVISFVFIIAATTVMGSIIDGELLLILYLFIFPLIIIFMIIFIKNMEPTI